jgi:hypothetical protein
LKRREYMGTGYTIPYPLHMMGLKFSHLHTLLFQPLPSLALRQNLYSLFSHLPITILSTSTEQLKVLHV